MIVFIFRIIKWSGEYSAHGTMMYYKRQGETEELFLPGPLKVPLELMVSWLISKFLIVILSTNYMIYIS